MLYIIRDTIPFEQEKKKEKEKSRDQIKPNKIK